MVAERSKCHFFIIVRIVNDWCHKETCLNRSLLICHYRCYCSNYFSINIEKWMSSIRAEPYLKCSQQSRLWLLIVPKRLSTRSFSIDGKMTAVQLHWWLATFSSSHSLSFHFSFTLFLIFLVCCSAPLSICSLSYSKPAHQGPETCMLNYLIRIKTQQKYLLLSLT